MAQWGKSGWDAGVASAQSQAQSQTSGAGPRPEYTPPGKDWYVQPSPYGPQYDEWVLTDLAQWAVEGADGGGSSSLRAAELQYGLGLKGIEVDWARVGIEREGLGIQREGQEIQRQGLAESVRSNKANEAAIARRRALDSAMGAVDSYLKGTQLADARRLAAFQESRALLPHMVNPQQKYFAGQEPGGPLATAASRFGLPFQGQEIQHKQLAPGILAGAPTPQLIGEPIMRKIEAVQEAGR